MSEHGAMVIAVSGHDGPGKKTYVAPVLECLGSDSTATGSDGTTSDGTVVSSALNPGS